MRAPLGFAVAVLAALLPRAAAARCAVERQALPDGGLRLVVAAQAEPVGCRTVTLRSDAPLEVKAWQKGAERKRRLRGDHLRLLPGGGWEIGAPGLRVGEALEIEVGVAGGTLSVELAPADRTAPPPPPGLRREETRTLLLDDKHPEWGFADATLAVTRVDVTLQGAIPAGWTLAVPADATVIDAGGLRPVPAGLRAEAALDGARTVRWEVPGAAPRGFERIGPGALTLSSPGVAWVTRAGPGVTEEAVPGGVRFVAPEGGDVRWRVQGVAGRPVIPDAETFVRGLDRRFADASLPEPAVPMWLKPEGDPRVVATSLYEEVRALVLGALPGGDPLRPRQLNRAWRSGWATAVERGLVLHRLLGQERIPATWALTGEHADPVTLTGYDAVLVVATVDGEPMWLDPACVVCAPGEISTRWLGKPALGGVPEVPSAPGRLVRRLSLAGEHFEATFEATGAAAVWLRERAAEADVERRAGHLAEALGMPDGVVTRVEGLGERGAPIALTATGPRAPRDPFPPDATPWSGGWGDALSVDPGAGAE